MENLFKRLKKNNCKLNKKKINLCWKEIKVFGHQLTCDGIKPDETKIETIKLFPTPKDKKITRFIGMVRYVHQELKYRNDQY